MSSPTKVWFITSASTELSRAVMEHALKQGDHVVATLRKPDSLSDLLPAYSSQLLVLFLDVEDPGQIHIAFEDAVNRFGRIDIVFNNAGTCIISGAEDMSEEHGRALFEVLLWGAMNVTKQAVKIFRDYNDPPGGHLLQVSSQATSKVPPGFAHYAAGKAALECISEGLTAELDPSWNIKISIIQPPSHGPIYSDSDLSSRRIWDKLLVHEFNGDPKNFARTIYQLVHMNEPPFYLPLHQDAIQAVKAKGESLIWMAEKCANWSNDVYFT